MNRKLLLSGLMAVTLVTLAISQNILAKEKNGSKAIHEYTPAPVPEFSNFYADEQSYKKAIQDAKKTPARTTVAVDAPAIEAQFDADFLSLRDELIGSKDGKNKGLKTPEDLDKMIGRFSDKADIYSFEKLGHQAQFVALQLKLLKPFKAFFYRAKEYVGTHTAMRAMIVSMLRAQISGINTFFPQSSSTANQWEIIFDYLTSPMIGMGPDIATDGQFYQYVTQVAYEYGIYTNQLAAWVRQDKQIWWDNKLFASFSNFTNEKDRYIILGAAEQRTMMFMAYMTNSALLASSAYRLDGLQASVKDVGTLFGVDMAPSLDPMKIIGLVQNGADGMSSRTRIGVLNKYKDTLFVLAADGQQRMSLSFDSLKNAAKVGREAWALAEKMPQQDSNNLFDPRVILPFNRIMGLGYDTVDSLLAGKGVESTLINGEKVNINVAKFFNPAPAKLASFYPQNWVSGTPNSKVVNGTSLKYRNYKDGMASQWDYKTYAEIFPDMTKTADGRNTTDVPKYARILSQTWGGVGFALPLSAIIF